MINWRLGLGKVHPSFFYFYILINLLKSRNKVGANAEENETIFTKPLHSSVSGESLRRLTSLSLKVSSMWTPCWCPWRTVCDATRGAVAISMTCSTLVHPKTWRSDPHREGYCSRCSVCRSDNPRSQDESIPIEVVRVQVFPRELIVIFTSNISFNILSKWFLDFWSE